jgi:hypothetical protein
MSYQWRIMKAAGLRVAEATAQSGDSQAFVVPAQIDYGKKRHFSIYTAGRWRFDNGDQSFEFGPGFYANTGFDRPMVPPSITTTCIEGPGKYFCIEPIDPSVGWTRTSLADLADDFTLAQGDVLVIVDGSVAVNGQEITAPAIVPVVQADSVSVRKSANALGVIGMLS